MLARFKIPYMRPVQRLIDPKTSDSGSEDDNEDDAESFGSVDDFDGVPSNTLSPYIPP